MDNKDKKAYSMLQIPKDVHIQLNRHSLIMGHFVSNLIKKAVKTK